MKYKFFNLAGTPIWECDMPDAVGEDTDTTEAIQKLFSNIGGGPPRDAICRLGHNFEGQEKWSVGPFDVLVQKES